MKRVRPHSVLLLLLLVRCVHSASVFGAADDPDDVDADFLIHEGVKILSGETNPDSLCVCVCVCVCVRERERERERERVSSNPACRAPDGQPKGTHVISGKFNQ